MRMEAANTFVPGELFRHAPLTTPRLATKRALDILVATLMLLAMWPVLLFLAVVIRRRTGGAVLFRHRRVGRNGQPFDCLKFRTMVPDADAVLGELLLRCPEARAEWAETGKLRDDPRVLGRVGRALRRFSLDELPQIFNVIRGDMSLVGPRPVIHSELAHYEANLRWYLSARPGLTGPWQVSGRNDIGYSERVALDVDYVRNLSLRRDALILLRTPVAMLSGRGAY